MNKNLMARLTLSIFILIHVASDYCSKGIGPTSAQDSNLGPVYLMDIKDHSNCSAHPGVQNLMSMVAHVRQGETYTVAYDVTMCGGQGTYARSSAVWIDWNGNEEFESDEQLGLTHSTPAWTHSETVSINFTVPTDAKVMRTRMRVQVQESVQGTRLDPCGNFSHGGTKDFSIKINPPPSPSGLVVFYSDVKCSSDPVTLGTDIPVICHNGGCYFANYEEWVDWAYLSKSSGDCGNCQKLCENYANCTAVECGQDYCAAWYDGACPVSDLHPDSSSDDSSDDSSSDSLQTCYVGPAKSKNVLAFEVTLGPVNATWVLAKGGGYKLTFAQDGDEFELKAGNNQEGASWSLSFNSSSWGHCVNLDTMPNLSVHSGKKPYQTFLTVST